MSWQQWRPSHGSGCTANPATWLLNKDFHKQRLTDTETTSETAKNAIFQSLVSSSLGHTLHLSASLQIAVICLTFCCWAFKLDFPHETPLINSTCSIFLSQHSSLWQRIRNSHCDHCALWNSKILSFSKKSDVTLTGVSSLWE